MAGELAWRGIESRLIEKGDGAISQPKMDLLGPRTMEFCRRWGIAEDVRNCPYNPDLPQDNVWLESFTGFEFGREPFPSPREEVPPPQSPVKRERCPQDMFDPILRRWVERFPQADLRYGTELLRFRQSADHVTAIIRQPDGSEDTIETNYLIGTDGGGSTVRQLLGIGMHGKPILTYTTNVVFRCPNFWALHDKPKGYRFIFIGPEGTWATLVAIDGHDRFRFSVVGDDQRSALNEADVRTLITRAMGKSFDFEITSMVPWIRRELVADGYGGNRVYIAGDAAHLNSPTGAFGMNTGMQDAVDLGWKLAAVLEGWGGPELLASYEAERRPVALRNIKEASDNLDRMVSPRKSLSPLVFERSSAGAAARAEFGAAYTAAMKQEWFTLHIHLGYRYDASPVIVPDGSAAPNDPPMVYTQTARPGSRAPHVWLEPERSTLDLFGRSFVLLRFTSEVDATPLVDMARARGIPLDVIDLADHSEAKMIYAGNLVMVRPDGFVAWRGAALSADATALLDQICGFVSSGALPLSVPSSSMAG